MSSPSRTIEPLVGLLQARDQPPDRGLAAPGLADHAERGAGPDREADVRDRAHLADPALQHRARGDREVLHQPVGAQQDPVPVLRVGRRARGAHARSRPPRAARPARPSPALPTGKKHRNAWSQVSPSSCGSLCRAAVLPYRHRAANRHPGGGWSGPAACPGWSTAARSRRPPSPAARRTAPRCRGAAGWRTAARWWWSPPPCPRTSPRPGRPGPAITPRSWVTRITAMPSRCRRSSISSRICFWIVTSSAVVGSSAISSFGSQASAMAIITRCRMPPDSWCG